MMDDELLKLEPVSYTWNEKAPDSARGKRDLGFIAEDVANVLPDAVARDGAGSPVGIDYVIPGNDDSAKAVALYARAVADAVLEGKANATSDVVQAVSASGDEFVEVSDES